MSEKTGLPVIKGTARNRAVYAFLRLIAGPFIKLGFKYTPYKPKSKTYIVLANHNSDYDQYYEGVFFKPFMRFVATEHLFRKGFLSKMLVFLVNPIPRKKGTKADETVRIIKESLLAGINVCLHAEGNRSFNGETGYISPRTGQLVKESTGSMITFRYDGGYLRSPRWSAFNRKGPLYAGVVREYSREELNAMTVDEINEAIKKDLYTNAFETQRKTPVKYTGKDLAENVELALYLCPKCLAVASLKSQGDFLSCSCGYKVKYNEYGFFEGDNLVFDNTLDWDKWQRAYLAEHVEEYRSMLAKPIAEDAGQRLSLAEKGKTCFLSFGTLKIFGDRLEFAGEKQNFVWPLKKIGGFAIAKAMNIFILADGIYYEIKSDHVRSALKYLSLYRLLSGQKYL